MSSWDGVKRRSDDHGSDSAEVILARIDERLQNIGDKVTMHIVSFEERKKEDESNFKGLYKWVFIGVGMTGAFQFIAMFFKH